MGGSVQLGGPDLLARLSLERAEAAVIGGADEDQPAAGGQRRAQIGTAGVAFAFRHAVGDAQIHPPGDLAAIDVYRIEIAPGRVVARHIAVLSFLDEEAVRTVGGSPPTARLLL